MSRVASFLAVGSILVIGTLSSAGCSSAPESDGASDAVQSHYDFVTGETVVVSPIDPLDEEDGLSGGDAEVCILLPDDDASLLEAPKLDPYLLDPKAQWPAAGMRNFVFTPGRTDTVTACTTAAGAVQCTSKKHPPCAGTHTHGTATYEVQRGTPARWVRCTKNKLTRCDGALNTVLAACGNSVPCGTGGAQTAGIWD